jgi:hypothetical protein
MLMLIDDDKMRANVVAYLATLKLGVWLGLGAITPRPATGHRFSD